MVSVVFIILVVGFIDWLNQRFSHPLARLGVIALVPYHATMLFDELYAKRQADYQPDPLNPVGMWFIAATITIIALCVLFARFYAGVEKVRREL